MTAGSLRALVTSRAAGAMLAQVWQAVGSFGLQILAAWLLGAAGLGTLSLCLSIIILATAVASGMVGDSLVILDRRRRDIRGALQVWTLLLVAASWVGVVVVLPATGLLGRVDALVMALALAAFQLEELVRRMFMATMRFWRLLVVDSAAVGSALVVVAVWAAVGPVRILTFFVALLVGQVLGLVLGILMLGSDERRVVGLRGAAIREVAGFGVWRGLQVAVPPLVLTAMRVVVTATVGGAALGRIELARIYVAPVLLSVQGLGSYLLSSYVRDRHLEMAGLVRRAGRSALAMMGAAALAGAVVVAVAPEVARLVSGPHVAVDRLSVAGWVAYVVASASCQPFASLAAARGEPARVLRCRLLDAVVVVLVLLVALPLGLAPAWTPFVLAGGLLLGGVLVRGLVLRPLVRRAEPISEA